MEAPQLFLWKKKLAKRTSRTLSLLFFRDPCGLKNRRGSFFLRKYRVKKKEPKKKPLRKTGCRKPGRKTPAEENALVTHLLDKGIDRRCGNVKGLWLLQDCIIQEQHPPSLVFGHFRFCVLLVVVKTDIHPLTESARLNYGTPNKN